MRPATDSAALLELWECGIAQPSAARADAFLRVAWPDAAPARTLGQRNARLLALHGRWFGPGLALLSHCPSCESIVEFEADADALLAALPGVDAAPAAPQLLEAEGHRVEFRLPAGADIAAASAGPVEEFGERLLERCVLSCEKAGAGAAPRELPPAVMNLLSRRMEALDPGASLAFELACPQCSAHWSAPLDLGQVLWSKVRAAAEHLLLDVDALARHYGWTEDDVLRLSDTRRAAYLQLVSS